MSQPGPKPTPTPLRLLQGGRADELAAAEPQYTKPVERPRAPGWLGGFAEEEWDRVIADLFDTGIYTEVDESALAAYCMCYARWRHAEVDLQKMADLDPVFHAAVIKTTNGNMIQNPLVGVAATALKNMHRLAVEFGMTPSARTALRGAGSKEIDPMVAKYGLE